MRKFRCIAVALLVLTFLFGLVACNDGSDIPVTTTKKQFSVEASNLSLQKGENKAISYSVKPVGYLSAVSVEIISALPSDCIKLDGTSVTGVKGGVATLKLVAQNIPNAAVEYQVETTLTATVAAETTAKVENLAVCGVPVVGTTQLSCDLQYQQYQQLVDKKDNARSLVTGTLFNNSQFKSVKLDTVSATLNVVIIAEDGKTENNYAVHINRYIKAGVVQVEIANPSFEDHPDYIPAGWTLDNLKSTCIASKSKNVNMPTLADGSSNNYGIQCWGAIDEEGSPSTVSQKVGNSAAEDGKFAAGDYVIVSVWISCRYGTSVTSIQLFAGEQFVEMSDTDPDWQFQKVSFEFLLTEADIDENGQIVFGLRFTQNHGGWCNLDDFSLEYVQRLYYSES